ncbi:MAG: FHA domain-containing protein [Rhodoferax sp.]|uniref:FHA domain-containing protein n=1 Tax=Rhodoferax sp. TaxID=50421 RepID=UPI00140056D0|nr:FHA domain-containing protein [Rhodoferax sp.]NDP39315.1 FHA domain-containing protein [Rhodoferax sp.]
MPKMIVSIDGVVIKEVQLMKDRTTLGRRPYNDIVIDNLAVSGEHAAVQMTGGEVYLEDLNSTNGTYVNGKAVKRQLLQDGDAVEVGKYKIKFVSDAPAENSAATRMASAGPAGLAPSGAPAPLTPPAPTSFPAQSSGESPGAAIKVLSGPAAGREVPLTKVVTTIGKPGVAVAAITRRQRSFVVHHVEGAGNPTLNGASIGAEPIALSNGDLIELAGTQMQFIQA